MKRRYEHTYVFVEFPEDHKSLSGKEALFYVDSINTDDSAVGTMCLSSIEYGKISLNLATEYTLKFKYPPVGVFQNGKEAYYFRRLPQRQYARGICSANSTISPVTSGLYATRATMNHESVQAAFNGVTHDLKFALQALEKGFVSVALDDCFSLCVSMTAAPEHILFFWDIPVARVNKEGKLILTLEEAFSVQINKLLEGT